MDGSQQANAAERNLFLKLLPARVYKEIRSSIKEVSLPATTMLYEAGQRIETVYFPQSGFISIVVPLENGRAVESSTVGCEGFVGLAAYLGEGTTLSGAVAQADGVSHTLPVELFLELVEKHEPLRRKIHNYTQLILESIAQSSACNRYRSIHQRCARWLLICEDRVRSKRFNLTQEYLAEMIGVRRPGVTVAARALKEVGLIKYSRGRVEILDRQGLERAACECYRRIRDRELELFGNG